MVIINHHGNTINVNKGVVVNEPNGATHIINNDSLYIIYDISYIIYHIYPIGYTYKYL